MTSTLDYLRGVLDLKDPRSYTTDDIKAYRDLLGEDGERIVKQRIADARAADAQVIRKQVDTRAAAQHARRTAAHRRRSTPRPLTTKGVAGVIVEALTPLVQRLEQLEARPTLAWRGTWKAGTYPEAAIVTKAGSLWVATCETTDAPGSSAAWKLIVKGDRK